MTKFIRSGLAALVLGAVLLSVTSADAAVRVRGYYRKDGTYVQPHYRSNPDGNAYNNWSYPGNTNPYTGETATGNPSTYLNNYYGNSSGPSSPSLNREQTSAVFYPRANTITYHYSDGSSEVTRDGKVLGATSVPIPGFESSSVYAKMHHSKINALFRYVYGGRNPSVSENHYWLTRLADKPLVGDMLGAMQWHKLQGITH